MQGVRCLVVLVFACALSACQGSAPSGPPSGIPSGDGAAPTTVSPVPEPTGSYAPDTPIPNEPAELASALADATLAVRHSVDVWIASGGTAQWPPYGELVRQTLYQQRIYRTLSQDPTLADQVIALLPRDVRREARANTAAGAALLSVSSAPKHRVHLETEPPLPADELLGYYRQAERRFGVVWQVLAAVNFVESKFGRVVSPSVAGARGPMQFLPSTWRAYGMGGDVNDPHDAILAAANYLHAKGAPQDVRAALFAYNPVYAYVKAVMAYADRMMRDPRAFYEYYNWQVFVLTPDGGSEQVTGPGT
jgi:hypothetical protein